MPTLIRPRTIGVAASIVLGAVGSPGSEFDWSWLVPGDAWMKRLGYSRLPIEAALRLLDALCAHLAGLLRGSPGSLRRVVRLRGTSGIERSRVDIRAALAARTSRRRVRPAGAPKR